MELTANDSRGQADLVATDNPVTRMTLRRAIEFALEKNREAIQQWEGLAHDDYRTVAWVFVRWLRPHPKLVALRSVGEVADLVEAELEKIFGTGDPWLEALGDWDSAGKGVDPYDDFIACWQRVRVPMGSGPLEWAYFRAQTEPLDWPHTGKSKRGDGYRAFLNLAYWLQRQSDTDRIIVACEKWGKVLGVSPDSISRWRQRAESESILVVERKGSTGHGATECRFDETAITRLGGV